MSLPLRLGRALLASSLGLALAAAPASAHHMMGGRLPSTFAEGLLSGLGHPVIGPDHLAVVLAIGIAAALVPAGLGVIAAFICASVGGVFVHAGAVTLPGAESLIAASVMAAGALVAAGRAPRSGPWIALAVVAGLLHGYGFGESIVGAERGVLGAYLLGLGLVMAAIAIAARAVARWIMAGEAKSFIGLRTAGLAIGAVGGVLLVLRLIAV